MTLLGLWTGDRLGCSIFLTHPHPPPLPGVGGRDWEGACKAATLFLLGTVLSGEKYCIIRGHSSDHVCVYCAFVVPVI